jgi:hypothetical protein
MAFVKGQSGNPGGRPKEDGEVKALAREYTEEAIERLVFWMRGDNPKASVTAAQTLLDRGYGKAPQAIGGASDMPPIQVEEIRIRAIDGQP